MLTVQSKGRNGKALPGQRFSDAVEMACLRLIFD